MAFGPPPGPFGPGSGGGPFGGPPGGTAPFGSGGSGPFGSGGAPPGGAPFGGGPSFGVGGIVVHRARLVPRMLLVFGLMGISFAITGLIIWFAVLGTADEVTRAGRAGERATSPGITSPGGTTAVSPPEGWPEALAPPAGATIVTSVATSAGASDEQLVMVVEITGEGPAVADGLRAQLAVAGLTVTTDAIGADGVGSLTAAGAGREASIAVSPNPARPGVVTVSWVLRRGLR